MSRLSFVSAAAVALSALTGLASARIEAPRYAVTALRLAGPASIPDGQSRQYTLTVVVERVTDDAAASRLAVVRAATERVQPALLAGAVKLTGTEVVVGQLRDARSVHFTLQCLNNEVVGAEAGSQLGARAGSYGAMGLPWWDKPAALRARLDGLESNALRVLCDAG